MSQTAVLDYRQLLTEDGEALYYGLPLVTWLKIGAVSVLMVLTFRFNLLRLWLKTNPVNGEPNWRHAICVPLISLYYLYVNRDDLLRAKARHSWAGLGIMVGGILMFVYGIWPGQNDFIKDFGMVVTLFGVVAMLCGWDVMRVAWFPIVFLVCAIPWPDRLYSEVASPLQHLAASVAVGTLRLTGVEALNSGTKIIMNGKNGPRALNVAEACAGLRSLMTFISIGGAVAFLSPRPLWQKLVVTASAVPIAVFCNVMRVTGMGYVDQWKPEFTEGFAHQFVGMVMLVPGFLLIMLVGMALDQLFIEEADDSYVRKNVIKAKAGAAPANWALPRSTTGEGAPKAATAVPASAAGKPAVLAASPKATAGGTVQAAAPKAIAAVKPVTANPAVASVDPVKPAALVAGIAKAAVAPGVKAPAAAKPAVASGAGGVKAPVANPAVVKSPVTNAAGGKPAVAKPPTTGVPAAAKPQPAKSPEGT